MHMTFDARPVMAKKDREIERLRARIIELETSRDYWRLAVHKMSDETGQLSNERDELAVALVWYNRAIQEVPELTVRYNIDMIDTIELAKKVAGE